MCIGLLVVGMMLQLTIGPIKWHLFESPANIIFFALYVVAIAVFYLLRHRLYAIRWAMTMHAALPAIITTAIGTAVYGLTNDRSTLSAWPFVMLYFWMTTILGLISLKHMKSIPFLLNHLGLFLAITAATLGSADMKRLKMTVRQGEPEWRAVNEDSDNKIEELDMAVVLNHFAIDEYAPRLVIISNETGKALPEDRPESLVIEDSVMTGTLMGHTISVKKMHQYCAQFVGTDSLNYVPWTYSGATTAALISIDGGKDQWVSNGSYMFPYRPVRLDSATSIVMPECEAKRFTSNVNVYTKQGARLENVDIEVNKPLEFEGWKIYQLSYDNNRGRWSDISILELVRDPWLPLVYAGIFMLIAGALWMFFKAGNVSRRHRKHEVNSQDEKDAMGNKCGQNVNQEAEGGQRL